MAYSAKLVDIDIYQKQLDIFLTSPRGPVGRELSKKAEKLKVLARSKVNSRTGRLRSSIHTKKRGRYLRGQYIEVAASVPYALSYHEGTDPRIIVPTRGRKVLRFFSKGVMVYTPMVVHPGTRPNRFLSDPLKVVV